MKTVPAVPIRRLVLADVPLSGLNIMTDVSDDDYQDQYSISTPGTAVIMPEDSTSSDTLSAAGLVAATPAELLTPKLTTRDRWPY